MFDVQRLALVDLRLILTALSTILVLMRWWLEYRALLPLLLLVMRPVVVSALMVLAILVSHMASLARVHTVSVHGAANRQRISGWAAVSYSPIRLSAVDPLRRITNT